jgi:predicted transcriptional regulator
LLPTLIRYRDRCDGDTVVLTSRPLGPLENEVMEILWARNEATVREVLQLLQEERSIAYTTVMTIMNNLAQKGLLEREPQGKAYRYRVALTKEAFRERAFQQAMSEVLERFSDVPIARFFTAGDLKPEEMRLLRQLIDEKAKAPEPEEHGE